MNLNKYTKAELISKFKNLQNKQSNNNSNPTISSIIIYNIIKFKSILMKITIIAFLIKSLKKYSLLRKLWSSFNWIIMAVFGFSLMDLYDIQFFSSLMSYIRASQFYGVVAGVLGYKINPTPKIEMSTNVRTIDQSSTANPKSGKISDWLNKQGVEPQIIEKEDNSHKKYYVLLLMLLISTGLIWYYWPNFNWPGWPGWPTLPGWFGWPSFFNRKPKDEISKGIREYDEQMKRIEALPDVPNDDKPWWSISKYRIFNKDPLSDTDLNNRLKDLKAEAMNKAGESSKNLPTIEDLDLKNITEKFKSEGVVDPIDSQVWFRDLTGDKANSFDVQSDLLARQINHFLVLNKTNHFPNDEMKSELYSLINKKIAFLTTSSKLMYEQWIKENPIIADKIDRFIDLETDVLNNQDDYNELTKETAMDSVYKDVAAHAAHEQDVWSNPSAVQSPMKDLLSPIKDAHEIQVDSTNKLSDLINTEPQFDDRSLLTAIKESFPEEFPKNIPTHDSGSNSERSHYFPKVEDLKGKSIDTTNLSVSEIERRATTSNIQIEETPTIPTESSNVIVDQTNVEQAAAPLSFLDQIRSFNKKSLSKPKINKSEVQPEISVNQPEISVTQEDILPEITEVKTGISSLFDQIKSRRSVMGSPSPKISQLGLGNTESPQMLSPLKSKPSLSNLFDDTEALFDDG